MHPVAHELLSWYAVHRRRMPWRDEVSPYRTWVSEIMLQQTRVDTVRAYFDRWMSRFPSVEALAAASLDDVTAAWSGLGYYSRARNLHAAARKVVAQGDFPATLPELLALPGVGPYTAGAIASIALGLDEVAMDGNVERVMSRLFCQGAKACLREHAHVLLPAGRAGDFNQALMDLGATICTPRSPDCGGCPVAGLCSALQRGEVERWPPRRRAPPKKQQVAVCGVLWRRGTVLVGRRPPEGLLGGTWELPGGDVLDGETPAAALARSLGERIGLQVHVGDELGQVRHVFTHIDLSLVVHEVQGRGRPSSGHYPALQWVDPAEPGDLGLSRLAHKALACLRPR